jgi:uncharacterized protein (DUF1697 family)
MQSLVSLLQKLGCEDVRTYIQSGNAVFRCTATKAETLGNKISAAVLKVHGFEPRVLLLTQKDLQLAITANPFPQAEADHKSLLFYFLAAPAKQANIDALNSLKRNAEAFALTKQVFYLHAPDGIGKSKLAERVEKLLGVAATARNWRTVHSVLELCL